MDFLEFLDKFPTEEHVIQYFIKIRYPKGINCNHCNSENVCRMKNSPKAFRCNGCKNCFSIFKGTLLEDTYTDLRKWMYALHLFLNGKKGISGLQLKREIKVTYKTAWRMLHKIRAAMGNRNSFDDSFFPIVEIDETYVGGKPRKGSAVKLKRGRGTTKIPVIGVICRKTKQVHAKVALPNAEGKKLTGKQLLAVLDEAVTRKAIVVTDEFTGYNALSKTHHVHLTIDHTKEYANGIRHTNNIESFWATLKRGIYGIYHHVSLRYLQNYISEFCFRYNNRKNIEIFNLVLAQGIKG
jgi:transposase-like protein